MILSYDVWLVSVYVHVNFEVLLEKPTVHMMFIQNVGLGVKFNDVH